MADWNPYTGSPDEGPGIMDPALYASPASLGELERRTRYFTERAQARREAERIRMRPRAGEYVAAVAIAFLLFALLGAVYAMSASAATPRAKMATHGSGSLCAASYFGDIQSANGTLCIPAQANGWAKYQNAAAAFWAQQTPPSPRTVQNNGQFCCDGDRGADGYSIPHWCRNAWPYFYYPHGVTTVIDDNYVSHVLKLGMPALYTSDGNGTGGYCTVFLRSSIYNAGPSNDKCQTYIHEWGHLLGWGHVGNLPSTTSGRQIMNPSNIGWVSLATSVCRQFGMSA